MATFETSRFALLLLALVSVVFADQVFHGDAYQAQNSTQKAREIIAAVTSNTTGGPFYSTVEEAEFLIEPMKTTFETSADDLPRNYFGLSPRKKLIHTVGVVGQVKWTPVASRYNYTGIFQSGAANAFLRMSSTGQPEVNGTVIENQYTPGLAFKFLRDGVPAASLFALNKLGSQESNNFLRHDFSNHVPDVPFNAPIGAQVLRSTFGKASAFPASLGLSGLAEYDSGGYKAPHPRFPWRVILHPSSAAHSLMPEVYPGVPYWVQMPKYFNKPIPLFQVYAIDDPRDDANVASAVLIGRVDLLGPVTTSHFGDRQLFFQHWNLESDLAYRPEWTSYAKSISLAQRQSNVTITYPDLPW